MNHLYRTVWNEITNTFVAVAENVKRRGKRSGGSSTSAASGESTLDDGPRQRRKLVTSRPSLMRLEPRLVFDGAAVDTTVDFFTDHPAQDPVPVESHDIALETTPAAVTLQSAEPALNQGRKEVAFIDTGVTDYQTLVDGIRSGIEVVLIESDESGLAQIADWSDHHSGYDAIHLLSHGSEGTLYLGRDSISNGSLADTEVQAELSRLGQALTAEGDLLIYGCSVATGETGQAFIANLAAATGADVAASNDLTGASGLGGDWELEEAIGNIEKDVVNVDRYSNVLTTPADQNFDSSSNTSNATSAITIDGVVYTTNGNANPDIDSYTPYLGGSATGFSSKILISEYAWRGGVNNTATFFEFSTSSGSDFKLNSISAGTFDGDYPTFITVTGYEGGSSGTQVVQSNLDFATSGTYGTGNAAITYTRTDNTYRIGTLTFGSAWDNIDTVVFTRQAGQVNSTKGIAIILDNLDLSDPTPAGPTLTSATYDASSNVLTVTGTNMTSGDSINETMLTLTGQGGATYQLAEQGAITATNATSFSITLNATDAAAVEALLNKAGASALSGATYNIAGAVGWDVTQSAAADLTNNAITLSNANPSGSFDFESATGTVSGLESATVYQTHDALTTSLGQTVRLKIVADAGSTIWSNAGLFGGDPGSALINGDVTLVNDFTYPNTWTFSLDGDFTFDLTSLRMFSFLTAGDVITLQTNRGGTLTKIWASGEDTVQDSKYILISEATDPSLFTGISSFTVTSPAGSTEGTAFTGGIDDIVLANITVPATGPTLANLDSNSVNWAGVGNTVLLDADANAVPADSELGALNSGNGNWSGASLTVQRSGTAISSDVLGFNTSGALFTDTGTALQSGDLTFATYTHSNGLLSISFTSSGTAATTALVQDVVRHINYRNDTPSGDATVRFTLSDGSLSTTADVTVESDSIYITNTTDTASINISDGVSFSEAVAIAAADASGAQTLVLASTLAGQTISTAGSASLGESLALDADAASGATLSGGNLTLGSGTTLSISNGAGDTLSIGGVLVGDGGITKTGAGTLNLSGSNTYTGATTVSEGTLGVSHANALGTTAGGTTVGQGATLAISGGVTIAEDISLDSNTGSAYLTNISGDNTLTGTITHFSQGGARVSAAAGTTLTISGIFAGGGPGDGSSYDLHIGDGNNTNTGTVVLSGANTFKDAVTLRPGTLVLANDSALGATSKGIAEIDGGTLALQGGVTITGEDITDLWGGTLQNLSGDNTFTGDIQKPFGDVNVDVASATTLTLSGTVGTAAAITDNAGGGVTKTGSGTLVLSGTNGYVGETVINGGTVSVTGDGNLGGGAVTLNGGTLTVTGSTTIDNGIVLGANGGTVSNSAAVTLSGVISGSGSLTKTGSSALTLSGDNTYTGATTLNSGVLIVTHSNALGTSAGGTTVANGTTLRLGNGITIADALTLSGTGVNAGFGALKVNEGTGSATVTGDITLAANTDIGAYNAGDTLTLSGNISGGFALSKVGSGTVVLSGSNNYTGTTTVSTGTLSIAADANLGSGSVTMASNTVLAITDTTNINNAVTSTGSGSFDILVATGVDATLSGVISGASALNKTGAGTLALSGSNTYTGTTTVAAGTLVAANDTALGTTAGTTIVSDEATLGLSGGINVAEAINFTYNGGGAKAYLQNSSGDNTLSGAVTLNTAGIYVGAAAGTSLTLSGAIDGGERDLHVGENANTGTVVLSGSNTFQSGVILHGGTLLLASNTALGSTVRGISEMAGGTLALQGGITITGEDITDAFGGTLQNLSGDNTFTGAIKKPFSTVAVAVDGGSLTLSGNIGSTDAIAAPASSGLSKTGSGTLILSGTNTYAGDTTISAGTLRVSSDANLGATWTQNNDGTVTSNVGGTVSLAAGTTLQVTGSTTLDNTITLAGAATIQADAAVTLSGLLSGGAQTLTKSGSDSLTLTHTGNEAGLTGGINVTAGTLKVSDDDALVGGTLSLADSALQVTENITIDNAITLTGNVTMRLSGKNVELSGEISGSGNLSTASAGSLALTHANTYTGTTTVNESNILIISAADNISRGTLNLQGNGTLKSTGSNVTLDNAIALDGPANLHVDNALTLTGNQTGSAVVYKQGSGTLSLSGAWSIGPPMFISAGTLEVAGTLQSSSYVSAADFGTTLRLTQSGSLGTSQVFLALGSTWELASGSHANLVQVNGSTTLEVRADTTLSGLIKGSQALNKTGAGALTLTGTTGSDYSGNATVTAGTLLVNGTLASITSVTVAPWAAPAASAPPATMARSRFSPAAASRPAPARAPSP